MKAVSPNAAAAARTPAANDTGNGAKDRSNNKGALLQDPFLNTLRREHVPVSVYLINGIKLQGRIDSFDQYVILLANTVTQMVYKHAISTIVPGRNVNPSKGEGEETTAGSGK